MRVMSTCDHKDQRVKFTCYYDKNMSDLARFCLRNYWNGKKQKMAHNSEHHDFDFPQIQSRDISHFKCKLKGCQGDAAAAKADTALASMSLPLADALWCSAMSEQRKILHWAPSWSLLPSTCYSTIFVTQFSPHGLMETGFREHLTPSWAVTYIYSVYHVQ